MKRRNISKDILLSVLFCALVAALTCSSVYAATVTTDKLDYAPGEIVIIAGSGWIPGETVDLFLHEEPSIDPDTYFDPSPVADSEGNIYDEFVVQPNDVGITFTLTATGLSSGYIAQTIFTDGNVKAKASPGATFTLTKTVYPDGIANCTGTGTTTTITLGDNPADTTPVPNNGSVKFEATSASNQGGAFINWTLVDKVQGQETITEISTNLSICVPGNTTGTGTYVANYGPNVCGNGITGPGEACDDGNTEGGDCCSSTCQFESNGASCTDDSIECTNDICNASGTCTHPNKDAGVACGSSSDTECDDPDTCNGAGVCLANYEPVTTNCGSAEGACTNQDKCDGSGSCTDNGFKGAATACGDQSDTECNNPDHCSGTDGSCVNEVEPATTTCGDAGAACVNQDYCDGAGGCTDNGFKSVQTACGDPTDTECNNPDHCSGTDSSCVNEVEPATTTCGDAEAACVNQDYCDGAGACHDNGFKSVGTACGSNADTDCDNPDTCNGSGTCQPNYEPAETPCTDEGNVCTDDECDGAGSCVHPNNTSSCDDGLFCTGTDRAVVAHAVYIQATRVLEGRRAIMFVTKRLTTA